MPTEPSLVSYVVITRNRPAELAETVASLRAQRYPAKEIVIFDNGSDNPSEHSYSTEIHEPDIIYSHSERNLGVSGGRNAALQLVRGDIIITIDDDAILADPEVTARIVDRMEQDKDLGVLALRIVDYRTGLIESAAFPTRDKKRDDRKEFETTWFIGAGHAVRAEVYHEVGYYRDYNPYGHEEIDLSLRIIDAGYRIVYFPATVRHKRSPSARFYDSPRFLGLRLKNRIKVALLNLPFRYVFTTAIMHSGQMLIKIARGNPVPVILAHFYLAAELPNLLRERSPIRKETVKKIREMDGPIVY